MDVDVGSDGRRQSEQRRNLVGSNSTRMCLALTIADAAAAAAAVDEHNN